MAAGANEETVKFKVELDPQGFRSQLVQLKQEMGLTLNAASYSFGQTLGAGATGFNTLTRDIGAVAGMFMSAGVQPKDSASLVAGVAPEISALMGNKPSYYTIAEWGALNRENMVKSSADFAHRVALSALPTMMGEVAGGFGAGAGMAATAGLLGGVPGMLVGGMVGYMGGAAVGDFFMEPGVTRYAAGRAISQAGKRYGISASDDVAAGVEQIGRANNMSGTETLSVLGAGLATGAFGQVSDTSDFRNKFSQLMRGAREISRDMQIELTESVQVISSMQEAGFGSIQGALGAARAARVAANVTGSGMQEMLSLSQTGAAMAMGQGMTADAGQRAILSAFEGVTLGMRNKSIETDAVDRLGGRANTAAMMAAQHFKFMQSQMGQTTMLAAYDPTTGQLDPNRPMFEPGMAFRQAANNLYSRGNPFMNLAGFMANQGDLAGDVDPLESALHQVMGGVRMARNLGGPATEQNVVNLMAVTQGMSRAEAAAIYGQLDPSVLAARQQAMLQQQAKYAQAAAPNVGGYFSGTDSIPGLMQLGVDALYNEGSLANLASFAGEHLSGAPGLLASFAGSFLRSRHNPLQRIATATPRDSFAAIAHKIGHTAGTAGSLAELAREKLIGRPAPRFLIPGSVIENAFSENNSVAKDIIGGEVSISSDDILKQDVALSAAVRSIRNQAAKTGGGATVFPGTTALFESSLGDIEAIRGTTDTTKRKTMLDALKQKGVDELRYGDQVNHFNKMIELALGDEFGPALSEGVSLQARREGTMAGFRFLRMYARGGEEAYADIAPTPSGQTRGGLAGMLKTMLDAPSAGGDSLDAMRADRRMLMDKISKAGKDGIAVKAIADDQMQAYMQSDLIRFAGEGGKLSAEELRRLEINTVEEFAVKNAKLAGRALGGPGGGDSIQVLARLVRVMDMTTRVLERIEPRLGPKSSLPTGGASIPAKADNGGS